MTQDKDDSSEHRQNNQKGSLLKSTGIVSLFTLCSRILGLVRDVVFASFIGASAGADAFLVAFKIPNFMRRLFAEGAFAQAFVPVLSEYKVQRSHEQVRALIDRAAGCLGVTLATLTVFGCLFAPWLAMAFAPGFIQFEDKLILAGELLRLTFPYLFFISLTALAGSILNTYNHFAMPAFAPILLNLCLISAATWFSRYFDRPIMALGWGVLVAGLLQLMAQLPVLMRYQLVPRPKIDFKDPGVKRILLLMAPAIFGVSVSQINLFLDTVLASFLETGSVSWLYYSDRLVELPLGVFGIAIGTAILPSLSRSFAASKENKFSETLDWAMRSVILIGMPAAVALFYLGPAVIATLFQYGEFSDRDVLKTTQSLYAYSLGVLSFMLIKVLAPGYFARQDTKTPVKIGIKAMVANMIFNLILIWPLAHAGLALATALSALMNAMLLLSGLVRQGVYRPTAGWIRFWLKVIAASAMMLIVLVLLNPQQGFWLEQTLWVRVGWLSMLVVAGLGSYIAMLYAMGFRVRQFTQHSL